MALVHGRHGNFDSLAQASLPFLPHLPAPVPCTVRLPYRGFLPLLSPLLSARDTAVNKKWAVEGNTQVLPKQNLHVSGGSPIRSQKGKSNLSKHIHK